MRYQDIACTDFLKSFCRFLTAEINKDSCHSPQCRKMPKNVLFYPVPIPEPAICGVPLTRSGIQNRVVSLPVAILLPCSM